VRGQNADKVAQVVQIWKGAVEIKIL